MADETYVLPVHTGVNRTATRLGCAATRSSPCVRGKTDFLALAACTPKVLSCVRGGEPQRVRGSTSICTLPIGAGEEA